MGVIGLVIVGIIASKLFVRKSLECLLPPNKKKTTRHTPKNKLSITQPQSNTNTSINSFKKILFTAFDFKQTYFSTNLALIWNTQKLNSFVSRLFIFYSVTTFFSR